MIALRSQPILRVAVLPVADARCGCGDRTPPGCARSPGCSRSGTRSGGRPVPGSLLRGRPALEKRQRGVPIAEVDAALPGAIVLREPEPALVPLPHLHRIVTHDREIAELRHVCPPFALVAWMVPPRRRWWRSASVREIVRYRTGWWDDDSAILSRYHCCGEEGSAEWPRRPPGRPWLR